MPKIYVASPLGFSPENQYYLDKVKARLTSLGFEVLDPWAQDYSVDFDKASLILNHYDRARAFDDVAAKIGLMNEKMIREADALLAILDGMEPDSGTCSELGFAAGLGKMCFALRCDKRNCGDFGDLNLNLQLLHFIYSSNGKLFRAVEEIVF